jgi:hypothetical protein
LEVLILPIYIIWQVRLSWRKKLVLSASLCLTIFVIVATVVRMGGLAHENHIDIVWGVFWQLVAADVALIVNSATALPMLFAGMRRRRNVKPDALAAGGRPRRSGAGAKAVPRAAIAIAAAAAGATHNGDAAGRPGDWPPAAAAAAAATTTTEGRSNTLRATRDGAAASETVVVGGQSVAAPPAAAARGPRRVLCDDECRSFGPGLARRAAAGRAGRWRRPSLWLPPQSSLAANGGRRAHGRTAAAAVTLAGQRRWPPGALDARAAASGRNGDVEGGAYTYNDVEEQGEDVEDAERLTGGVVSWWQRWRRQLPLPDNIPRATMTGLRTYIQGGAANSRDSVDGGDTLADPAAASAAGTSGDHGLSGILKSTRIVESVELDARMHG